jgi:hypothetical protein
VDGLRTASGTVREGTVQLAWHFLAGVGGNDPFANAQILAGGTGSTEGSNAGATKESGEPAHTGNAGGASIWYHWRPLADGPVTVDTLGSTFDTLLAVYTGSTVDSLNLVTSNDDLDYDHVQSLVTFDAIHGKEYWIAVDGYDADSGSLRLQWRQPLGTQPLLTIARTATPARFNLTLSGVSGVSYTIEYSTNLAAWNVLTNLPSSGAPVQFSDPNAGTSPTRHYRAKVTPLP